MDIPPPIQQLSPLDEATFARRAEHIIGEAFGLSREELTLVVERQFREKFPNEDSPQQLSRIEITAIAGMKILLGERRNLG